jgi:integrase
MSRQRGHVRRVGNVWRLKLRTLATPEGARRQSSHRLGTIRDLPTRAAARQAADRLIERLSPPERSAATAITWSQWCDVYIARHLVLLSRGSRATRTSIIRRHLRTAPAFGGRLLHQITETEVQAFVTDQAIAGVPPSTVRARFALLRRMLRAAAAEGLAATPPRADRIEFPRVETVGHTIKHKAFLPAEVHRILASAPEPLGTACALARELGLRASEVMGLTWACVDLERGRVEVRQQAHDGEIRPLKSKSSHAVLMAQPELLERLRRFREGWRPNERGLLFADAAGRPVSGDAMRRQLHELLDAMGIRRRGFHAFRHACALAMAQAAVSPEALRRAMRHASLRVTAVYLTASPEDVQAALLVGRSGAGLVPSGSESAAENTGKA